MSDEILKQILTELREIKTGVKDLKTTVDRIEEKQSVIYAQTGNLTEYHTEVMNELREIKDQVTFTTFKATENEKEIFLLKRKKQ